MDKIIFLEKVIHKYGNYIALDSVDLTICRGQIVGLIGPNGAGKTTLLKIICGLLIPTKTEHIEVLGNKPSLTNTDFSRKIGIVLDSTQLYDELTAYENLKYSCLLYGVKNYCKKIEEYLRIIELSEKKDNLVGTFSTGMKQKLNIIRALITGAEILILDEPTSGLDPISSLSIYRLLRELNQRGVTILLSSHNMKEIEDLCDNTIFIKQGRILVNGSPNQLKKEYSKYIFSYKISAETFKDVRPKLDKIDCRYSLIKNEDFWELTVFNDAFLNIFNGTDVTYTRKMISLNDVFILLSEDEDDKH